MWDHIINIHQSELLHTKIKESRINEHNIYIYIYLYIYIYILFNNKKILPYELTVTYFLIFVL